MASCVHVPTAHRPEQHDNGDPPHRSAAAAAAAARRGLWDLLGGAHVRRVRRGWRSDCHVARDNCVDVIENARPAPVRRRSLGRLYHVDHSKYGQYQSAWIEGIPAGEGRVVKARAVIRAFIRAAFAIALTHLAVRGVRARGELLHHRSDSKFTLSSFKIIDRNREARLIGRPAGRAVVRIDVGSY